MEFTKKDLNKTLRVKPGDMEKNRTRWRIDASGKVLGRLAVDIAKLLLGKHKAYYSDFWDAGDFVLVENIDKIKVTGKKLADNVMYAYSGYKGNLKQVTRDLLMKNNPSKLLTFVVRGMLSKNKLRDKRLKRFKMVTGTTTEFDHFKPTVLTKIK
ncbi:MAG: 50S ribosomal protein L13 [candidate division SR1 bacterium]|nr:50S ribosomal protein L13 [candidate division SR1 bacterium]